MIDVRTRPQDDPLSPAAIWRGQADADSNTPPDPHFPGLPSNRPAFGALFPIIAAGCILSMGVMGLIGWGLVALTKMLLGG